MAKVNSKETNTLALVNEITALREKYKSNWNQSVFNLPMPCILTTKLTMEQLKVILEHIVDTGESIMDGYSKYILNRPVGLQDLNFKRM